MTDTRIDWAWLVIEVKSSGETEISAFKYEDDARQHARRGTAGTVILIRGEVLRGKVA